MARSRLAKKKGHGKDSYTGQVSRYGYVIAQNDKKILTICLQDVKDARGKLVADHIWIPEGVKFQKAGIYSGEIVEFEGLVNNYTGKYGKKGYSLRKISHIKKITNNDPITQMIIDIVYELCGNTVDEYIASGRNMPRQKRQPAV